MILFYFETCLAYNMFTCTPTQTDNLSVFLTVVFSHSMVLFHIKFSMHVSLSNQENKHKTKLINLILQHYSNYAAIQIIETCVGVYIL